MDDLGAPPCWETSISTQQTLVNAADKNKTQLDLGEWNLEQTKQERGEFIEISLEPPGQLETTSMLSAKHLLQCSSKRKPPGRIMQALCCSQYFDDQNLDDLDDLDGI